MSVPNLGAMRAVADRLDRVGLPYAFIGGSIVNLLVDHPELTPARPTDDVDVIIDLITGARYSEVEASSRRAHRIAPAGIEQHRAIDGPAVFRKHRGISFALPRHRLMHSSQEARVAEMLSHFDSFAVLRPLGVMPEGSALEKAEQLCLDCGLCCDGTLYDVVKLEPGDDAANLKRLGLPISISRGKTPAARFPQPCSALCKNRACRVYAERPWQCRTFECKLLKDAKAGRIAFEAAAPLVKKSKRHADKVRRLLRELGDREEHRPLGERVHRTSERLEAGNCDENARAKFADMSLAVHRLKLLTQARFYAQNDAPASAGSEGAPKRRA